MTRVLIAASPFGVTGRKPLDLLEQSGWEIVPNPYGRRLKAGEVNELLRDIDIVIAGTEPYRADTLVNANRLKMISRVGIGLDSVDLDICRQKGIAVGYTPDAPSDAVAELTVANIIALARHIHASDRSVRENAWNRLMGRLVREMTIGIVGCGRIGSRVIRLLEPFQPRIKAFDLYPAVHGRPLPNVTWCGMDEILETSDLVSLHIPLNARNRGLIGRREIARMKTGALLVNTARGGVVDDKALEEALLQKHLGGAALDVFETEPYEGPLTRLDNVILTAHIGASANESRYLMELGAVENCLAYGSGHPMLHDAHKDESTSV